MVTSIVPGTAGANTLGVDTRFTRSAPQPQRREEAANGDRVEINSASLAASRESVRAGIAQVHEALAMGHEAQAMLVQVQGLVRGGASQDELSAVLAAYREKLDAAVERGAAVLTGEDVSVQAEPGAPAVTIPGVDLGLGGDLIGVSEDADVSDASLAQIAQKSLEALQEAMGRLVDAVRALEAHQGFLGAAEATTNVRGDLDADSARLLALQVRQGLEASGGSIANVEPQAVLALFKT